MATALITGVPVWAHGVAVFAWVEGDTVHVEGKFGGGRRPVNAPVEVYDPQDNLLIEGVTDENGEFSFKVPRRTEMKVVLLAGMGHRGEWTIPVSDLEAAVPDEDSQKMESGAVSDKETAGQGEISSDGGVSGLGQETAAAASPRKDSEYVTTGEIEAVIEKALDKKLKPMMQLLVEEKQSGPSMTDVLGGIGYIFGMVGVAAYVASRRKKV